MTYYVRYVDGDVIHSITYVLTVYHSFSPRIVLLHREQKNSVVAYTSRGYIGPLRPAEYIL